MLAEFKALCRYTFPLLVAYSIAWTLAYILIIGRLDFTYYAEWFVLAWTFRGFEMVGFTWLLSLVIFLPLAAVAMFVEWRLGKRQERLRDTNSA